MSAAFKKATEDSKKILSDPSQAELLELYDKAFARLELRNTEKLTRGLFSSLQGRQRRGHQQRPLPRHGKAKKNAWQKVVDEGISADAAQERYVALVEKLKAKHGFDENKVPVSVGK
ncbi:hypothetical protein LLEC1_04694 [Akanthomyces lecanii]|uniref:ACB domain-containing protein n=1 Tax=Cordyceps confragosa TaxID=2714763 RepID=A0A179I663_CORDF|nr:hypothetical protein LLEC1_04694 [Akanthomyces lecanii]